MILLLPVIPTKSVKLWHFDWLCYLRLLGECRSFLKGKSQRQSPTSPDNEQTIKESLESIKSMAHNHNDKLKSVLNEINDHRYNLDYLPNKQSLDSPSKCLNAPKNMPMNVQEFRRRGKEMVDYIANYLETIQTRRVTPNVEPGYLKNFLPKSAPVKSESWDNIMEDFEKFIMPGVTHWQHPRFHAYFPAGNSYPSILADMISDGIGCVGFSWVSHKTLSRQ